MTPKAKTGATATLTWRAPKRLHQAAPSPGGAGGAAAASPSMAVGAAQPDGQPSDLIKGVQVSGNYFKLLQAVAISSLPHLGRRHEPRRGRVGRHPVHRLRRRAPPGLLRLLLHSRPWHGPPRAARPPAPGGRRARPAPSRPPRRDDLSKLVWSVTRGAVSQKRRAARAATLPRAARARDARRPPPRQVPQTSELSISVTSKSIRLIFGRIDCSRRCLEAEPKSSRRNGRIC